MVEQKTNKYEILPLGGSELPSLHSSDQDTTRKSGSGGEGDKTEVNVRTHYGIEDLFNDEVVKDLATFKAALNQMEKNVRSVTVITKKMYGSGNRRRVVAYKREFLADSDKADTQKVHYVANDEGKSIILISKLIDAVRLAETLFGEFTPLYRKHGNTVLNHMLKAIEIPDEIQVIGQELQKKLMESETNVPIRMFFRQRVIQLMIQDLKNKTED